MSPTLNTAGTAPVEAAALPSVILQTSRCAAPITSTPDDITHLDLTLDGFTDWLLEIHGSTFDAMDTVTGDAYCDLLDSFARTNSALNLLDEFRAAQTAQATQKGGAV